MPTRHTFPVQPLMRRAGVTTARALAEICGTNCKAVHNRTIRGLSWAEADEFAVRCGFLPWEVWPDWEDVDPAQWLAPVCTTHGNSFVVDRPDLTQTCSACAQPSQRAA